MNYQSSHQDGFSLIEVTLAIGVAAFCLVAVLGLMPVGMKNQQSAIAETQANTIISQITGKLRAAVRVPPGHSDQSDSKWLLHPHNGGAWDATPDILYFNIQGNSEGSSLTAASVYRATIQYIFPPTDTTSLADITVTWPAAQADAAKVAGSVESFVAINR